MDQALGLLASLTNPSFLQIQKFHMSLHKIEAKIRMHTEQAALIKGLIALASEQNFSDQNIIGEIVTKLNEFRVSVVDAINATTALEQEKIQEHADRVQQLDLEHAEFQRDLNQASNIDLVAVVEKINEMTAYLAQRNADRKIFEEQLDVENSSYAEETEIYTDLKNNTLREIAVAEQAVELINSHDYSQWN